MPRLVLHLLVALLLHGTLNAPVVAQGAADSRLVITYIANEGIQVSHGDTKVLIDGLHREYKDAYAFLPDADRERIETAAPPFDGIDLILVSHRHGDHFHPNAVARHLRHNPGAVLVSSQQVIDELDPNLASRIITMSPRRKERVRMTRAGVDITLMGIGHGDGRHRHIQNLAHLIEIGGKKLLHVGDAVPSPDIFAALHLDDEEIDIAFLPFWFLLGDEGLALIRDHIAPRHIVAIHISPTNTAETLERLRRASPNADAFTTLLESRRY